MKLEIGSNDHFEVRHEIYPAEITGGFSILYLSDLHLNRFKTSIIAKILSRIHDLNPDIILLGGDYIDFKSQLVHLDKLLKGLSHRKNVLAIAGNHDYRFGVGTIEKLMKENQISWIENDSITLTINNNTIQIDGSKPSGKINPADFSILCLHHPIDIKLFKNNYQLAFAGHLHGCQFVFWQNDKGLYPGRLFYKWNTLLQTSNDCRYYISKGMGDTLPVRLNCSKEMIFVEVAGTGKIQIRQAL
ncbi:MAG: metallophosphoesterase [Ferruginibacter sp.]